MSQLERVDSKSLEFWRVEKQSVYQPRKKFLPAEPYRLGGWVFNTMMTSLCFILTAIAVASLPLGLISMGICLLCLTLGPALDHPSYSFGKSIFYKLLPQEKVVISPNVRVFSRASEKGIDVGIETLDKQLVTSSTFDLEDELKAYEQLVCFEEQIEAQHKVVMEQETAKCEQKEIALEVGSRMQERIKQINRDLQKL